MEIQLCNICQISPFHQLTKFWTVGKVQKLVVWALVLSPLLLSPVSTRCGWHQNRQQNPTGNALYTTPSPRGCAELSCRGDVAYMPQSVPINRSQPAPCALTPLALPGRCMHKILNKFEPQNNLSESAGLSHVVVISCHLVAKAAT